MLGNLKNSDGHSSNRWRVIIWGIAALLLLTPLIAMQFTNEVNWSLFDFAIAGALLLGAGLTYEIAVRKTGNLAYRAGVGVALATTVLLLWINGAVGIIGAADNPANLLFGAVLVVGIIGVALARFQPSGLARALVATASAQVVVGALALVVGGGTLILPIIGLTGFFTALWVLSAWLFQKATAPNNL